MAVSLVQTVFDRAFKQRDSHDAFYRELYRDDLERLDTMGLAGLEGGAGDTAAENGDSWSEKVYAQLEERLRAIFAVDRGGAPRRLLELGAGSGYLSCRMAGPTLHASLIDKEPLAVAVAQRLAALTGKAPFVDVTEGDLFDRAPTAEYDIVFSVGVFEELNAAARVDFVRRGRAWLRPGGCFLIAVPSFVSPTMIWLWRRHGKASEVFLPQMRLRRLLQHAGFTDVRSSGLGPVVPRRGFTGLDRSLARWFGMLVGAWGTRP